MMSMRFLSQSSWHRESERYKYRLGQTCICRDALLTIAAYRLIAGVDSMHMRIGDGRGLVLILNINIEAIVIFD